MNEPSEPKLCRPSAAGSPNDRSQGAQDSSSSTHTTVAPLAGWGEELASWLRAKPPRVGVRYWYWVAILAVLAGILVRLVFLQTLGSRAGFVTLYPAVMFAALYGGMRAGLLAAVLSAVVADYFWMGPPGFAISETGDWLAIGIFLAACVMVSAMTESMHRAVAQAAEARAETRVAIERERAAEAMRESQEREKIAQVLRAEQQRFKGVLERLPAYVVLLSPDYHVPFANRMFEERFGKALGRRCYEYLFQRTEPCENCESFNVLKTHAPHRWEWVGPDGCSYEIHDFPFTDADGSPMIMEMGIDVTAREERYRSLFQTLLEGFCTIEVIFDAQGKPIDGRCLETNPAFEAHTGLHNVKGQRLRDLIPELEPHWLETFGQVALTGEAVRFENEVKPLNRSYEVCAYRIGRPEERKVAILFNDISERKRVQAELERLVEERTSALKELVEDLEHFSYTLIHDMRAPLRTMQGFSETVLEECAACDKEQPRSLLERIKTSTARMDRLITDALNFTKAIRLELPLEPVDMGALLRGMLESYPELTAAKADVHIEGEMPPVMANPAGLTQCFSNLLTNAVKFVAPGRRASIRVRAERRDGWVRVWFEDNGIGIPPEALGRVFDLFHRVHKQYEGTGIGLALVRKVTQRMGGRVGVESEVGKGSLFWIELRPGDGKLVDARRPETVDPGI